MSKYTNVLDEILEKYSDNPIMIKKLDTIMNNLPTVLQNAEKDINKREKEKEELTETMTAWCDNFLSDNQFLYDTYHNYFIKYDKKHYSIIGENDIAHTILQSLNSDKDMREGYKWKQKTRIHAIKIIKDTSLYKSIPESYTIQFVLNHLYPNTFKTKYHAKYFLTIIGNAILKNNDDNIYFINPSFKDFLLNINLCLSHTTGRNNITDMFKMKYYDHEFNKCRVVDVFEPRVNADFLKNNIYDIMTVATYHANRYGTSDNYLLNTCSNTEFVNQTLYLKNNDTPSKIIDNFIDEFTVKGNVNISFKNIYFLWRQYLNKYSLPHIVSQTKLKNLLEELNIYNREHDLCLNMTSKYSLDITQFQTFWVKNISISDKGTPFEIDELANLFNDWCKNNKLNIKVNDEQLREIILSLYPDINIINNKYINNIICKSWNKQEHIDIAMSAMSVSSCSSFNSLDCYKYYCNYVRNNYDSRYIVNKEYFEEYSTTS